MEEKKEVEQVRKNILSNEKSKTLFKLFLWLCFFFLIVLLIRIPENKSEQPKQPDLDSGDVTDDEKNALEKYFDNISYKYECIVDYTKEQKYEQKINGYVGNNYNEFIYNNKVYDANLISSIDGLDLVFLKFTPTSISEIVNKGKLVKQQEIDGVIIYTYEINTNGTFLNEKNADISIKIYEYNNEIDMVVINLTNYKSEYSEYKITISYEY